jgi:hypothetical protein
MPLTEPGFMYHVHVIGPFDVCQSNTKKIKTRAPNHFNKKMKIRAKAKATNTRSQTITT